MIPDKNIFPKVLIAANIILDIFATILTCINISITQGHSLVKIKINTELIARDNIPRPEAKFDGFFEFLKKKPCL